MAREELIAFLVFLLLSLAFALEEAPTEAPPIEDPKKAPKGQKANVVVEGMVYCESCEQTEETGPIPGARVSVICKNRKNSTTYSKVFTTDSGGYFYAQLDEFKIDHTLLDHPLQSCSVYLRSSPLSGCNQPTNVNRGIDGSPLRYESKVLSGSYYDAVIYAVGPLAFSPEECS